MLLLLKLLLLLMGLLLAQELLRRGGMWLSWIVFAGAPLCLSAHWLETNQQVGLFPWVKLYTILFSVCWLTVIRYTTLGQKKWPLLNIVLLLALNILEAVTQDGFGWHFAHFLVLTSGVLLLVTLPSPWNALQIDAQGGHRDLLYHGMTRGWIIDYSLWNWAFVFLNFPSIAGQQFAVLLAALIIGMSSPERWLQVRGYTLAVSLILLVTFPAQMIAWTDTSHWNTPERETIVSVVCLLLAMGYAVRRLFGLRRQAAVS